jgi:hypothetical protein
VNGSNVGTNSATYTTTTLTNGQIVSCVMTSNASCASPATATSNSITMTITGVITYCSATTTTTTYERITNVTIGSINNTSANSSYTNYSALSTNVSVGTGYPITITIGSAYTTDRVIVFVDWNNNGVFTDAGETVYTSAIGVGPFTGGITVPAGTSTGAKRMRIRLTDTGAGPNLTSCGASSYGEVEDYTLTVIAAGGMAPEITTDLRSKDEDANNILRAEILKVFPNPSDGNFTVQGAQIGDYFLVDEAGKLIQSFRLSAENNYSFNITNLENGFYVLAGQNQKGAISKQKIVVNK